MSSYKMIALDLDGTLNNSEKSITPKTKMALIKAQQAGVIVALASGRPAPGLNRERAELNLDEYGGILISYNGGKVIRAATGELLYEKTLTNEQAVKLLVHLEKFTVTPIVDDGEFFYATDLNGFHVQREAANNNMKVKLVENMVKAVDFSPGKVLIASPENVLRPIGEEIMAPFPNLEFIYSAPFYLEATAKGISKANSLTLICHKLGIMPSEVMAFGDGENDRSMLEFAGLGIAMGNACESLKAIADEITFSNNNDGIASSLQKHFNFSV